MQRTQDRIGWSGRGVPPGRKELEPLARTPLASIGIYRCGHRNVERGAEQLSAAYVINFPRDGVYVKHVEGRELVVDPRRAVFFNRGECWCTSHPSGAADAGIYLSLRHDALLEMAAAADPRVRDEPARVFAHTHVALAPELELESVALAASASRMEPAEFEERALRLAHELVGLDRPDARPLADRPANGRHRELADAARTACGARFRERLGLDALAGSLGVSVFHLCRTFRAEHGTSLHAHLVRLRLTAALEELAHGAEDLTGLALSLGFSSHSHFTRAFRSAFRLTPSQYRRRVRA